MNDTATVKTLTAEVQVLTVGNRQITLSVVKQLDSFDAAYDDQPLQFVPFGRVHTGKTSPGLVPCGPNDRNRERSRVQNGRIIYEKESPKSVLYEWVGLHKPTGALIHVYLSNYRDIDESDWLEEVRKWAELPLIVLAGLR